MDESRYGHMTCKDKFIKKEDCLYNDFYCKKASCQDKITKNCENPIHQDNMSV